MCETVTIHYNFSIRPMILSFLAALAGVMLTATQAVLIVLQGSGICLNEGCEIVDSLTTVPPLYFNLAGLCFFLLAVMALNKARGGSETAKRFASLLLLAGLAGEAVLVFFQHFIVQVYCSYCLIILALVVTANLFMGLKQFFRGFVVFSAVFAALASLNFNTDPASKNGLQDGTLARLERENATHQLYLFFSSSCSHCEGVIETLHESSPCSIYFNPVDTITSFTFPGVIFSDHYSTEVNRLFLKSLNIDEIPALLSRGQNSDTIIRGGTAIKLYLEQQCIPAAAILPSDAASTTEMSNVSDLPIPGNDDSCTIDTDCLDPQLTNDPLQQNETTSR